MPSTDDTAVDVGIELGGTKIIVAASAGGTDLLGRERIPTGVPDETLAAVRQAIATVAHGRAISAIGIGSFGPLDLRPESPKFGTIISTPKPGWSGVDVLGGIVGDSHIPTTIDTDVAAALRAEHHWGAATTATAAYATVGTGLGVALWADGHIVSGANHSEVGHIRVPRHPDDSYDGVCPYHGDCLEGMASGPAIDARWGMPAELLEGAMLTKAVAMEAWYLAHGVAGMCAVVPVETVVLGGGVAKLPGLHEAVSATLPAAANGYPPIPFGEGGPAVVPPALGDDAGVLGAIELARSMRTAR